MLLGQIEERVGQRPLGRHLLHPLPDPAFVMLDHRRQQPLLGREVVEQPRLVRSTLSAIDAIEVPRYPFIAQA
jgi:hypothetical protein